MLCFIRCRKRIVFSTYTAVKMPLDEQDDSQNLINTTKEDFVGTEVLTTVQSHMKNSYFNVTIKDDTNYIHKQTACWLLTGVKSKISNDRLLRVQQTNEKK
jgi:hypothetical protein